MLCLPRMSSKILRASVLLFPRIYPTRCSIVLFWNQPESPLHPTKFPLQGSVSFFTASTRNPGEIWLTTGVMMSYSFSSSHNYHKLTDQSPKRAGREQKWSCRCLSGGCKWVGMKKLKMVSVCGGILKDSSHPGISWRVVGIWTQDYRGKGQAEGNQQRRR